MQPMADNLPKDGSNDWGKIQKSCDMSEGNTLSCLPNRVSLTQIVKGEVVCRDDENPNGNVDSDDPCKGQKVVDTTEKDRDFGDGCP